MIATILALLIPFALIGALIALEKLVGALQAQARRARMRARTRRSLRERAMKKYANRAD